MQQVPVKGAPLSRLAAFLTPQRGQELELQARRARSVLGERVVWNLNSTASGGGVAELLQTLVAYARGAGIDARWLVLDGDPEFFRITKRIHNLMHGVAGDGGDLGEVERRHLRAVLDRNFDGWFDQVNAQDLVILHDPQTAGLVDAVRDLGAKVIWRCHIGRDTSNDLTDRAWTFVRPMVEPADAFVFSRREYLPEWVPRERAVIIPPSLDPFAAKNTAMDAETVARTLGWAGLVSQDASGDAPIFVRRDGSRGVVQQHHGLLVDNGHIPGTADIVLQVGRWDRLKDPQGVLLAFADHASDLPDTAHLLLAGPEVNGVADDPEAAAVLGECVVRWRSLPEPVRSRIHLAQLPMDDVDENAYIVNALQRHAAVVVQKSLVEGFGLTVTEPMWKARPVVASAVGGIQDQIEHGTSGLLLPDPTDLDSFAQLVAELLADKPRAARLGTAAHERVRDRFLGDRHLIQYVDLFVSLIT